jgi:phage baseplate assembly protein V
MSQSLTRSTEKRFYGVVEAIVTDVNDPNDEGRLRVQFPWFDDKNDHMETEWCRVAMPSAGDGYGSFYPHRVGEEVAVAFVHGDMRFPIILGGLYNGKDKPATHRDDDTEEILIRTHAGHVLRIADSQSKKRIEITDSSGNNTILIDTEQNRIQIKASSKISIEGGDITIQGDNVDIKANQNMTLQGNRIDIN